MSAILANHTVQYHNEIPRNWDAEIAFFSDHIVITPKLVLAKNEAIINYSLAFTPNISVKGSNCYFSFCIIPFCQFIHR